MVGLGSLVIGSGPAFAYSGGAAATYADNYATNPNQQYIHYAEDCTNFVSQSLHAGAYPFRNYGSHSTSTVNWWYDYWTQDRSDSWSLAFDFWQFLINDYPGGWTEGTAPGSANNYYTPDSVVTGDVLFYDFGQGGGISHAAIQVGIGTDPNLYPNQVWYGNYVDEHTSNRYHAFWSLKPYNPYWSSTTILFMHIDANN